MATIEDASESNRGYQAISSQDTVIEHLLSSGERIHDLVDAVPEQGATVADMHHDSRLSGSGDRIYELVDVLEERPVTSFAEQDLEALITKRVSEIAERIAREMVPDIAERVIREAIEKLKSEDGE